MNIFVNIFDPNYHRASFRFIPSSTAPLSSWWRRSSWSTTPASKSILVPSSRIMWRTFLCLSPSSGLGFGLASSGQGGRSGKDIQTNLSVHFLTAANELLVVWHYIPLKVVGSQGCKGSGDHFLGRALWMHWGLAGTTFGRDWWVIEWCSIRFHFPRGMVMLWTHLTFFQRPIAKQSCALSSMSSPTRASSTSPPATWPGEDLTGNSTLDGEENIGWLTAVNLAIYKPSNVRLLSATTHFFPSHSQL